MVTPRKLKSQLQAVKTTMAPYGIDLGLRDSKKLNKQEMSENKRETDSKRLSFREGQPFILFLPKVRNSGLLA